MSPLRIHFLGTSAFAVPSLRALAGDKGFQIECVWTQPDRPVGRKQELTAPPIKDIALELGIPVMQPEKIAQLSTIHSPLSSSFDFLVVVSYGQILTQAILDAAQVAPVNVHASLLPRWRGASPIQHAILGGDSETGVTIQRMVKELDAGPILAQEKTSIGPRETATTLHDRLADMGAQLLLKTLKAPLKEKAQDETHVTLCKKLTRENGIVTTAMTAEEIDRRVRALTPWPAVTIQIGSESLKLLETSLDAAQGSAPLPVAKGTILHLVRVQVPGGKPISGAEWARKDKK